MKPFRRGQKNDYRDAEAIISAALSPGMHFVGVKSVEQQAEQALHRVRNDAISQRLRDELLGVGLLSASALRVKVADVQDFVNGRNFAAYLGMAPGHRGTGGKVKIGKIRRGHDRYLRQLLIHGARAVVQHLGNKQDPQGNKFRITLTPD